MKKKDMIIQKLFVITILFSFLQNPIFAQNANFQKCPPQDLKYFIDKSLIYLEAFSGEIIGLDEDILDDNSFVEKSSLFQFPDSEKTDPLSKGIMVTAAMQKLVGLELEREVAAIIFSTQGNDLTLLKESINQSNNYHDLEYLLYHKITSLELREKILRYFAEEYAKNKIIKLHLLSDIDDTLYAALNDRRYPRKTLYPGVLQLHKEVSGLTFISARPPLLGLFENKTHEKLNSLGVRNRAILAGDTFSTLLAPLTNNFMAKRKIEQFQKYKKLFPEYQFIWLGDNGQGDVETGLKMLKKEPEIMKAVLIHNIRKISDDERENLQRKGIFLFHTYAGAAEILFQKGLIGIKEKMRIKQKTLNEMQETPFLNQDQADLMFGHLKEELSEGTGTK